MLTPEQGRTFVREMNEAWNSQDRARWMTYFADDFAEQEPADSPAVKAPEKLNDTWEATFAPGGPGWKLDAIRVITCGNEIAVYSHHPGIIDGKEIVLESMAIWTVDDDLKAHFCRVWFEAPAAAEG